MQLRGDLPEFFSLGAIVLTPSLAYTVTRTRVDPYGETGGGFPAQFGRQSHTAHEIRLGAAAAWPTGPATALRARIEGVHRFDRRYGGVAATVSGLFPVEVRGARVQQDWARLGVDLVHRLAPTTALTASIHAATAGEDPEISGGISLMTELR